MVLEPGGRSIAVYGVKGGVMTSLEKLADNHNT